VFTVNVALVAPAATVTLAGTVATAVLLLESVITLPPTGAALLSVTVPVDVAPPITAAGLRLKDKSEGGITVKFDVPLLPFSVPEIVA
jgi:hypothetical protein